MICLLRNSTSLLLYRFAPVRCCLLLFCSCFLLYSCFLIRCTGKHSMLYREARGSVLGSTRKRTGKHVEESKHCGIEHFCEEQGAQGRSARNFAKSTLIITVFPRTGPSWTVLPRTDEGLDIAPLCFPVQLLGKPSNTPFGSIVWQENLVYALHGDAGFHLRNVRFGPKRTKNSNGLASVRLQATWI